MTWDNWGTVWQLDHIKPLGLFDLTQRSEVLIALHYKNLQPLLRDEHDAKTAREAGDIVKARRTRRAPRPIEV